MSETFFAELKRRHVVRVAIGYLIAAWVAVQVVVTVSPILNLPDSLARWVLVAAIVGFPIALAVAWFYERTAAGVAREGAGAGRFTKNGRLAFALVATSALALSAWVLLRNRDQQGSNVLAIAPFRVTGGAELAYLREGLMDLFAIRLSGEAGPRAVDTRTMLAAWRRAAGAGTPDLAAKDAFKVARSVGAGLLLLGEVTAIGNRVTLNGRLYDAELGREHGETASVDGRLDDLPILTDALATQLLLIKSGEQTHGTAQLTTSFPALHAFLAGKASYRRNQLNEALAHYNRALELDSMFALAALERVNVANWMADDRWREFAAVAHRLKGRLSTVDRLSLEAASRYFGSQGYYAEAFAAADSALRIAPDRPELWFIAGDAQFHHGPRVGMVESWSRARESFDRALLLDSTMAVALDHRAVLAALTGDTATARALAQRHYDLAPKSESNGLLRWLVGVTSGDSAEVRAVRARYSQSLELTRVRITGAALVSGRSVGDAELASRTTDPAGKGLSARVRQDLQIGFVLGREDILVELLKRAESTLLEPRVIEELTAEGIRQGPVFEWIERRIGSTGSIDLLRLHPPNAWYWFGLWQLAVRHDLAEARRAVAAMRGSQDAVARHGAIYLDAQVAAEEKRPDAPILVLRADSLSQLAPTAYSHSVNLFLARALEAVGQKEKALQAIRRRSFQFNGSFEALAPMLREEGRLAELNGDRAGAITAYRHFLALRYNASPAFRSQSEGVSAALARLARDSGPR